MKPEAEKNIKSRLTLEAIVEAEKIEISDERVNEEIEKMASRYGMKVEDLKAQITPEEIAEMKMDLAVEEATVFVGENAKEVAKKAEKKTTTKKAADKEEKAEKKPAAKKTTTKKAADKEETTEKKPAAKKTTKKKEDAE